VILRLGRAAPGSKPPVIAAVPSALRKKRTFRGACANGSNCPLLPFRVGLTNGGEAQAAHGARRGQIDPLLTLKIGLLNGRQGGKHEEAVFSWRTKCCQSETGCDPSESWWEAPSRGIARTPCRH
jgi:hypothetical protein